MAQPIKIGQVNRPLTCEEHDSNIDALLARENHTGTQDCNTIESSSFETCVRETTEVTSLRALVTTYGTRLDAIETTISSGGSIQNDLQALRTELLGEISDVEVVVNGHTTRLNNLDTAVSGISSSISAIEADVDFEVGQLNIAINANANNITALTTRVANNETGLVNTNNAISAETTARNTAIGTVNSSITAETNARIAADNALGVRIDNEISARQTGDNTINGTIYSNFTTLNNKINDEISDREDADAFLQAQINTINSSIGAVIPTGTILMWPGAGIPAGFIHCNASEISRTTYAALFAVIGTKYGSGSSTTFRTPYCVNRFPRGSTATTAGSPGTYGGDNTIDITNARMPAHNHTVTISNHSHTVNTQHHHQLFILPHDHIVQGSGSHQHELFSDLNQRGNASSNPPQRVVYDDTNYYDSNDGDQVIPYTKFSNVSFSLSSTTIGIRPPGTGTNNRTDDAGGTLTTSTQSLGPVTTSSTGSGTSFEHTPEYFEVKFIIKT